VSQLVLAADSGNVLVWVVWFAAAAACVASGIAVISFSNPFYSALALIGNLASLAVLYLLLSAEFVAAAQVLVYAGAVMVMFLFVIAYLGGRADAPWAGGPNVNRVAAVVAAAAILLVILVAIGLQADGALSHAPSISGSFGSPEEIGRLFLTDYLLAFEITSVVLLIAAVGGVVLGAQARRLRAEEAEEGLDPIEPAPVEPAPAGPPRAESPVEVPAAR
jgi:NADH-quinone oxidoreductase subunit J